MYNSASTTLVWQEKYNYNSTSALSFACISAVA